MKKTGFLYDSSYLLHDTGTYHPEVSKRLEKILQGLDESGILPHLIRIEAKRAERKHIELVHSPAYIDRFGDSCLMGRTVLDCPDNQMCSDTFEVAHKAVGGVIEAVRLVATGEIDNAFCAVRPPGHHAESDTAMGFCYFNNVAIAARYLQVECGIKKIAIIDFDVHHGNGTQHIFEKDPYILYFSIHQHPTFAYPGTGRDFERGTGPGEGFTVNCPLLPGQGDKEYMDCMENRLKPALVEFQPEFIIVSAGFDAHIDDDMSDMCVTTPCFARIMRIIADLAEKLCRGKLVSVLEGGYCLSKLPELAADHVRVLLDDGNA